MEKMEAVDLIEAVHVIITIGYALAMEYSRF